MLVRLSINLFKEKKAQVTSTPLLKTLYTPRSAASTMAHPPPLRLSWSKALDCRLARAVRAELAAAGVGNGGEVCWRVKQDEQSGDAAAPPPQLDWSEVWSRVKSDEDEAWPARRTQEALGRDAAYLVQQGAAGGGAERKEARRRGAPGPAVGFDCKARL